MLQDISTRSHHDANIGIFLTQVGFTLKVFHHTKTSDEDKVV